MSELPYESEWKIQRDQLKALLERGVTVGGREKDLWVCDYCGESAPFDWKREAIAHKSNCLIPKAEEIARASHVQLPQATWIEPYAAIPFCIGCGMRPSQDGPLCGGCRDSFSGHFVANKGGGMEAWVGHRWHAKIAPILDLLKSGKPSPHDDPIVAALYTAFHLPCPDHPKSMYHDFEHDMKYGECAKFEAARKAKGKAK